MAEALDNVHKRPICAEPKTLKYCLNTTNIDSEPERYSLASTICSIFFFRKFLQKPTGLPTHVHFRLAADDPIWAKRPLSFQEFEFKSTYIPEFDPSYELWYQITVHSTTNQTLTRSYLPMVIITFRWIFIWSHR